MDVADDTERQINQLYNDVNAIYSMLDTIQKKQVSHDEKFDDLQRSVTGIAGTQMRHGNRLNELDVNIEKVGEQVKELRVTQLRRENRFTEINQRFDAQDEKLDAQDGKIEALREQVNGKLDLIMKALDISPN
jgi:predicted  nucleic acid-binding Zn-ribbon protein